MPDILAYSNNRMVDSDISRDGSSSSSNLKRAYNTKYGKIGNKSFIKVANLDEFLKLGS